MASTTLRIVAVYIPILSGSLSILGSSSIIYSIYTQRQTKLSDPQHRILLGMSIFDMFYSLCKALTFALYPKGYGVPYTFGNLSTCALQGFFTQFGYATGSYNLVLSLYYYLTISRGMRQRDFARRLEKICHASIVIIHVGFATSGAAIGLFNPTPAFCYIAPFPYGCVKRGDCTRFGTTYPIYYEIFAQLWIQLAYAVIIVTNLSIWRHVRAQELTIKKYAHKTESMKNITFARSVLKRMRSKNRYSRKILAQSMLYVGAFFLCWTWTTVFHLIGWVGKVQAFWPTLLINAFLPLQGFWNAFVYARPRYLRIRAKGTKLTFVQAVRLVFFPTPKGVGSGSTTLNSTARGGGTTTTTTDHVPGGTADGNAEDSTEVRSNLSNGGALRSSGAKRQKSQRYAMTAEDDDFVDSDYDSDDDDDSFAEEDFGEVGAVENMEEGGGEEHSKYTIRFSDKSQEQARS